MPDDIEKLQVGDVGTAFRIRILDDDVVVNLSTCTEKQIIFKKPDDTIVEEDAVFYTDGSDGYIQYVSVEGDIDQTGKWKYQGYVEFGATSWHTNYVSFLVKDNLEV